MLRPLPALRMSRKSRETIGPNVDIPATTESNQLFLRHGCDLQILRADVAPGDSPQFDALRGPTGALLIGDAETVAQKILYVNEVLGGLSRITVQMGVSALPHEKMLRSIELLGTDVAPIVRKQVTTALSHGVF